MWIQIFDQIGLGDWLRYLTGAMLAWMFFLGSPASALFPGILLGILIAIGLNARPAEGPGTQRT